MAGGSKSPTRSVRAEAIQYRNNFFVACELGAVRCLDTRLNTFHPFLLPSQGSAMDKSVLEDLYLPYRPKRRTKATIAREKGLDPLARYLWEQEPGDVGLQDLAARFVNTELGVSNAEEALEGARHIVAEQISETADFRAHLRQMMMADGVVVSRKAADADDPEGKFKMYYEYSEPASKIPSHRMLSVLRSRNGIVTFMRLSSALRMARTARIC